MEKINYWLTINLVQRLKLFAILFVGVTTARFLVNGICLGYWSMATLPYIVGHWTRGLPQLYFRNDPTSFLNILGGNLGG